MLEPDRPYDNLDGERPDLPEGYTQERQAEGYVTFALFRYTQYLVEVEAFKRRFGGQWLLSDSQAEREASDAIHQIAVESPNNERDDSYLRDLHRRTGGELHPFLLTLADEQIGRETHHEWQDWAAACGCAWDTDPPSDPRLFPTARTSPGIRSDCPLHAIVMAGSAYCIIVDEDWMRIEGYQFAYDATWDRNKGRNHEPRLMGPCQCRRLRSISLCVKAGIPGSQTLKGRDLARSTDYSYRARYPGTPPRTLRLAMDALR